MLDTAARWSLLLLMTTALAAGATVQQEAIAAHNKARAAEAVAERASNLYELVWDASLAKQAQDWANKCVEEHRNLDNHGENLYYRYPRTHPDSYYIDLAVNWWMDEKKLNHDKSFDCCYNGHYDCCHYSQVVASRTRRVGCGVGHCATLTKGGHTIAQNAAYVVCFYEPRGNYAINGVHVAYKTGATCSACDSGDTCHNHLCRDS